MTTQTAKREEAIAEMEICLERCARQFSFYESNHRSKTPPDHAKADVNHEYAVMCYEALTNFLVNR